jgi:hypothetical protein
MRSKLRLLSICILVLALPLAAVAQTGDSPVVIVDNENFGDVVLGEFATAYIDILNTGFDAITIESVTLEPEGGDFAVVDNPAGATLGYGQSATVVITFTPTVLGSATATLVIDWQDGIAGSETVELAGTGVESPANPVSVQEILDFFDQSVADGTLVGQGPGNSADGRRGALRNKIKAAGDILEDGEDACEQLLDAYQCADGLPRPPDFVAGSAAGTLAQMILDLMGDLGCE